jgi:flagellar motor switch protein FliM
MSAAAESPSPLQFAVAGEPVRRAVAALEREQSRLATALRRALPFLTRRDVPVTLDGVCAQTTADLLRDLALPAHVVHLAVEPGGAAGALMFDANALGLMLDGVLGGDGRALPTLSRTGLTAPQTALVTRTVEGVVRTLGETLHARVGVRIEVAAGRPEAEGGEGTPIACAFSLGAPPVVGRMALVLPRAALLARDGGAALPSSTCDPRITGALADVDLELVVALARLPMKLAAVLALKVGDTLPLDVLVGHAVCVRADNRPLFRARPTTSGSHLAVRIEGGHER